MTLNAARWAVLVDMAYELGGAGLAQFSHFLAACRAGDWERAAAELQNSKLFQQVPRREIENIAVLRSGEFPEGVTSDAELIQRHEGCTLEAKPDNTVKGEAWVIGWGHDIPAPTNALTCTQAQADEWFAADMALARQRAASALGGTPA